MRGENTLYRKRIEESETNLERYLFAEFVATVNKYRLTGRIENVSIDDSSEMVRVPSFNSDIPDGTPKIKERCRTITIGSVQQMYFNQQDALSPSLHGKETRRRGREKETREENNHFRER